MEQGTNIRIIYVDGKNRDGTDHVSKKDGILLEKNGSFISIEVEGREVMIPLHRVIRIEKMEEWKRWQ